MVLAVVLGLSACGGTDDDEAAPGVDSGVAEAAELEDGASPADAAAPDAADAADAAPDVVIPPKPDGGAPPCASLQPAPAFCDDFDDGDLKDDWQVLNVSVGSSAALDTSAHASAPASFAARTKAIVAQEAAFAHLRTTLTGAPARVRMSFTAFFPVTTLSKGSLAIATIDVSQNHFFTLFLRDTDPDAPGPTLEESVPGTTTRHVLGSPPPANTWTRIVVDVDLATGKASVSWDATKALDGATIATTPVAQDPTIRVGALYVYGPQDPFEARFDDVLVEYP
jgi:hypothetical protein